MKQTINEIIKEEKEILYAKRKIAEWEAKIKEVKERLEVLRKEQ